MNVWRIDIGFVSRDRGLVDFLAEVFELEGLEPLVFPQGTVYPLAGPGGRVKVMVPAATPAAPSHSSPFYAQAGLRYLTVRVDDLDGIIGRATERGATLLTAPRDYGASGRLALFTDPDGNTIEVIQEPRS